MSGIAAGKEAVSAWAKRQEIKFRVGDEIAFIHFTQLVGAVGDDDIVHNRRHVLYCKRGFSVSTKKIEEIERYF